MKTPTAVTTQGRPLRTGSNSPLRPDVHHTPNFATKLYAALCDLSQKLTTQRQTTDDADNSPSGHTSSEERNKGNDAGQVNIGDFARMNLTTKSAPEMMPTQASSSAPVKTATLAPPPTPNAQPLSE
ncbi:hypothetical protein N0V95_000501 [Ascochyta clinopodiicola]|nr:hypothetical protein N0V95_000501 [Ascochyta clinopodiicola]